ncbi:hypothetical protein CR513_41356, partial [Mucuna pruriens]
MDYKIERVLLDQESFANVLYWSMFQRLGLSTSTLEECSRTLFGFAEDLKEIQIGPCRTKRTKISTALDGESEGWLVCFLIENQDVFTWTLKDMPGIDLNILCHHLSITPRTRLVAQRRRRLGEEKQRVAR